MAGITDSKKKSEGKKRIGSSVQGFIAPQDRPRGSLKGKKEDPSRTPMERGSIEKKKGGFMMS